MSFMAGFLERTVLRWAWQNEFRQVLLLYACPIVLNCEIFLAGETTAVVARKIVGAELWRL